MLHTGTNTMDSYCTCIKNRVLWGKDGVLDIRLQPENFKTKDSSMHKKMNSAERRWHADV